LLRCWFRETNSLLIRQFVHLVFWQSLLLAEWWWSIWWWGKQFPKSTLNCHKYTQQWFLRPQHEGVDVLLVSLEDQLVGIEGLLIILDVLVVILEDLLVGLDVLLVLKDHLHELLRGDFLRHVLMLWIKVLWMINSEALI